MTAVPILTFPTGVDPGVSTIPPQEPGRARALEHCRELELGGILFFPRVPFNLPRADCEFLMAQSQGHSRLHKSVSYRPLEDEVHGFQGKRAARERTRRILRAYSDEVLRFVNRWLTPYAGKPARDYASFRPLEEDGRDLPLHKRNDLLHVDAFPSRPTRGGRILRLFTNIHPFGPRVWRTGAPFSFLADRYALEAGLKPTFASTMRERVLEWVRPSQSPYDRFMLRFHDFLKENREYQASSRSRLVKFPPMSSWMGFTDGLAHAVLSGQYALEQAFVVPVEALVLPSESPLRILEALAGRALA